MAHFSTDWRQLPAICGYQQQYLWLPLVAVDHCWPTPRLTLEEKHYGQWLDTRDAEGRRSVDSVWKAIIGESATVARIASTKKTTAIICHIRQNNVNSECNDFQMMSKPYLPREDKFPEFRLIYKALDVWENFVGYFLMHHTFHKISFLLEKKYKLYIYIIIRPTFSIISCFARHTLGANQSVLQGIMLTQLNLAWRVVKCICKSQSHYVWQNSCASDFQTYR